MVRETVTLPVTTGDTVTPVCLVAFRLRDTSNTRLMKLPKF